MAVTSPTESTLVTSSYVKVPPIVTLDPTCNSVPTRKLLAIPTPPSTTNAPVDVDVDSVVELALTIPPIFKTPPKVLSALNSAAVPDRVP